jgi:SAM-dependent methyltransferase
VNRVVWHDVECGDYTADLPLWDELVARTHSGIMELGCGTGRVTRHIGKDTSRLTMGLDRDPELVSALWERSQWRAGDAEIEDVRSFDLVSEFDLVLAPMQLIQLLAGRADRASCLACVANHLIPGGLAAFAIVEELPIPPPGTSAPPLPDVQQIEGWIYSSLPLEPVALMDSILLRRLRQTVDPDGNMSEELNEIELAVLSAASLEEEGHDVGLHSAGRREIPATEAHVGSTVVLFEKEG